MKTEIILSTQDRRKTVVKVELEYYTDEKEVCTLSYINRAFITFVILTYPFMILLAAKSGELTIWKLILSLLMVAGLIAALLLIDRIRLKFPTNTD